MTTNNMTMDDIMTTAEVMTLLKIKRTSLYHLIKNGKLVARGTGQRHIFLRSEVMELLLKPKTLY